MRLSKIAATVAVVAAGGILPMVTASPAAAATPQCVLSLYYQNNYVPGSSNLSPSCVMGYGAQGNAVRTLQTSLNRCYGKGLVVDGIFGTKTRDALKSVQSRLGITVDGVYGPQTARAMNHTIAEVSTGCDRISF